jgi:hypothetical protein
MNTAAEEKSIQIQPTTIHITHNLHRTFEEEG